jgi:hypothetical protein
MGRNQSPSELAYHAKKHINSDGSTKKEMFDPVSGEFHKGKNAQIQETANGRLQVKAEHPEMDHHMYKFIGKKK